MSHSDKLPGECAGRYKICFLEVKGNVIRLTMKNFFFFLILISTGCASVLGNQQTDLPDFTKIRPGMHRQKVEALLGEPITDMRAPLHTGASRVTVHQFYVRDEDPNTDPSFYDGMVNRLVGFHKELFITYYDISGRVITYERSDSGDPTLQNGRWRSVPTEATTIPERHLSSPLTGETDDSLLPE